MCNSTSLRSEDVRSVPPGSHYEAALEFYPGFHLALRNLAILCDMYLSDSDCAIDYYERYAAAVPEDQKVSMWIADLRGRVDE